MDLFPCLLCMKQKSFHVLVLLFCCISVSYGYDSLDPYGNITVRWDVLQENEDFSKIVKISIVNNQLFRHVELPGWRLSWTWPGDEVIWNIQGAEATEQGDCSAFRGKQLPHCCLKKPTIIDLLPGAPYNVQVPNCCKAGVLSSMIQDPVNSLAAFQMHSGSSGLGNRRHAGSGMPANFSLGLRGYTCGRPVEVPPTVFYEDNGRRKTHAVGTWNITCSFSQARFSPAPTCCVSLSAFYSETIVPCPKCSCACNGQPGSTCVKPGDLPPISHQLLLQSEPPKPVVQCSDSMCPINVHWHVKQSYREYWRVKITVTNLNYAKNYSDWTLVVLHPNLSNVTEVFSFNYKPLNVYRNTINDTGMFFGIDHYNGMLLQAGITGNVQTEMLMHKDESVFTFKDGWTFPRKISFNGEDCVMPAPDMYPQLPSSAHLHAPPAFFILLSLLLLLVLS